jgi:hypothetical protein
MREMWGKTLAYVLPQTSEGCLTDKPRRVPWATSIVCSW